MVVGFSNEQAGRDVAAFFLDRGRRRPALVLADDQRAQARGAGFLGLLAERGVPLAGEFVVRAPASVGDGRQALRHLFDAQRAPDCIFCSSDQLAIGVLFEAMARGVRVPEKLAIMGFGNTAISEQTNPPLTVVAVDGTRIGREAARSLIDALERAPGKRRARPRILDVGYRILERGTT
jgi:LacI family gluconate utilization system Gnt-I transcriptional repressor